MVFLRNILIVLALFCIFPVKYSAAQEFKTDYTASYTLPGNAGEDTRVTFDISLTKLRADTFIDTYTLSFPSTFEISEVTARDDAGPIEPEVVREAETTQIKLEANDIHVGQKAVTAFTVEFKQKNLFRRTGSIWEVMIPTVGNRKEDGSYKVKVSLPPDGKTVSISKPKPSKIENNMIEWHNPTERTIYAVFGPKQTYRLNLIYDLENAERKAVKRTIALPPDTLHQKIYISSLDPAPDSQRVDIDGNFLADYTIEPGVRQTVVFRGYADIFAAPRDEVRGTSEKNFKIQEKHMLEPVGPWTLLPSKTIRKLNTAQKIHNFVLDTLTYDYERLKQGSDRTRYGAKEAMKAPDKAVCLEYSDTFIAIARANGIPAREIQGYAITDNARFRPVSLVNDVLHSWPEYYDGGADIWKQTDPTWGDTSGIDYFGSFDLNHIAFVIHGKSPIEPLPAGMYKLQQGKNISVEPVQELPEEIAELTADPDSLDLKKNIDDGTTYKGSFKLVNRGNTFRYEVPVTVQSGGLIITPETRKTGMIAPGNSVTVEFTYKSRTKGKTADAVITASADGQQMFSRNITVTPSSYRITILLGIILIVIFGAGIIIVRKYVTR